MAEHGTASRYNDQKCRCDDCRAAASLLSKLGAARRAKYGPGLLDSRALAAALQDVATSGISWQQLAKRSGLSVGHFRRIARGDIHKIQRTSLNKIEKALRTVIAERQAALAAVLEHLDVYHEPPVSNIGRHNVRRMWPPQPLLDAVTARYGSLKQSGYRTQLARLARLGDLSDDQADRWCHVLLGCHPGEVWPDWFAVEAAS